MKQNKSPLKSHPSELKIHVRLNKFLSNSGLCSRREADTLIKMGLVQINGKIITEMGYQIKPTDEVKYDGARIEPSPPVYLLLNKPKGFISTYQKGKIKKLVQELIPYGLKKKILPVEDMGRSMKGLIVLTNDQSLIKKLNNSKAIPMVYQVLLDQNITKEIIDKLKAGKIINNKTQKVKVISYLQGKSKNEIGVEVNSLNPTSLDKLFEIVGLNVIQMDRIAYGSLTKKDLPRGKWRKLSNKEIGFLKMMS